MEGIDTALELIQRTAVAANGAKKLGARKNSHTTTYLMPSGDLAHIEEDNPPRSHTVYDIDSLSGWVDESSVIWHSDAEVVAVLDDEGYRQNVVQMPLPNHPKFVALEKQTGIKFHQKPLIEFLRLNLKPEIESAFPGFISTLRSIRIQQSTAGESNVQHGRESMGRTIDNAVTGADSLPDEIIIKVPLWLHLDATVSVDCQFSIDIVSQEFIFRPKPGQIEQARAAGQAWLHEQLETACEQSAIYFGRP